VERDAYYDRYWSEEGYRPCRTGPGRLLRQLLSAYAVGRRCLDLGCGDGGTVGTWATRHSCSYVGVDVSVTAVSLARARGLNATLIEDAASLPFDEDSFDVVVASEVFEHLFDPLAAVVEARRVLRRDGVLLVTVPNVAHWRVRADLALLGRWHPGGDDLSVAEPWRDPHLRFFTPRTLGAMLRRAGFDVRECSGFSESPVLQRVPVLRRLVGDRPAGSLDRRLTRLAPSVLGMSVYAVALPA
jgi:methionine biosynthesis protein MetW